MSDKLSKLQSYSLSPKVSNVNFIKLKNSNNRKENIDEKINAIKRDKNITFAGRENEIAELKRIYFFQKKKLGSYKNQNIKIYPSESSDLPVIVGIKGEAGIGKTRLVTEFLKPHLKNSITGSSDNSVQNPYSLFISLIKSYCGIANSDSQEEIKSKIKFTLNDLCNYEKNKPDKKNLFNSYNLICHLLGFTVKDQRLKLPAGELKIHMQLVIRNFIEAAAAKINFSNEPLIIICEDVHWIDDSSADTLSYLLSTLNVSRNKKSEHRIILFLFLYRPEYKVMKEAELKSEFTEILLEPLDYNSVQKIISSKIINKNKDGLLSSIPQESVKLLTERSEGNPLFIQEWIKMFGDKYSKEEISEIKNNKLKHEDSEIEIPESINLLINKRLNRLNENELQILQYASVLGNEFSDMLLKGMSDLLSNYSDVSTILSGLIENKFIKRSDKTSGSEKYFLFHHDVIKEVVYESIPAVNRKILHKTAGEVIENLFGDRIEQYYYVLCENFEKGEAESKTIEYLEKAGDKARENFENEKAVGYYEKLCVLTIEKDNKVYSTVIFKKLQIFKILGKWNESISICKNLLKQNYFKKNVELYFQLHFYLAEVYHSQSYYTLSNKNLLTLSKSKLYKLDINKYLQILGLICLNYYHSGNNIQSENIARIFFETTRKSNDQLNSAKAYEYLGIIEKFKGHYNSSNSFFLKSINIFSQLKNLFKIANLNNKVGRNYLELTDYKKALEYFEKSKLLSEKIGDMREHLNAIGNISVVFNAMGKNEKVLKLCKKKIEFSKRINYQEGIAGTLATMGNYYYNERRFDDAFEKYSEALRTFEEINKITSIANMNGNIALIHMHRGNYGEALKHFRIQLKINENMKHKKGLYLSHINLANLYKKLNQSCEASKNYEQAILLAKELESILLLAIAHYNYAELLYKCGELEKAKTYIDLALMVKENEHYKKEVFYFELLNLSIQFNLEMKKNPFDFKNKLLCLSNPVLVSIINKTENLLNEASEDESKAKVHYELWKMNKKLEDKNMKIINHKKLALKHFKLIHKKTADIEIQNYIFELS